MWGRQGLEGVCLFFRSRETWSCRGLLASTPESVERKGRGPGFCANSITFRGICAKNQDGDIVSRGWFGAGSSISRWICAKTQTWSKGASIAKTYETWS
jgi:hypothetical protein